MVDTAISLTACEFGHLWTGLAINEMSSWFLTAFETHAKDAEIKQAISSALQVSRQVIEGRKKLLAGDGHALPQGFDSADIKLEAPPLFTDRFMLQYLDTATRLGLEFHARSLTLSARSDVREHYIQCINTSIQLDQQIKDTLVQKGMLWRTPSVPAQAVPEMVQKDSYMNGWFGNTRPLNSMELTNLYSEMDLLSIIEALCLGFAQSAETKETKELLVKGSETVREQLNTLSDRLLEDQLPIPPSYVVEVTTSTANVFSDRLAACHIAGLFGSLITQAGLSLGSNTKHDLLKLYMGLISEAGIYSEKIAKFLIAHEWLEKVPGVVDHESLVQV